MLEIFRIHKPKKKEIIEQSVILNYRVGEWSSDYFKRLESLSKKYREIQANFNEVNFIVPYDSNFYDILNIYNNAKIKQKLK